MLPVAPLHLEIRSSKRMEALRLGSHCLGALAVLLAAIPVWSKVLLLIALGISLVRARRSTPSVGLILHGDGRMQKLGAGEAAQGDSEVPTDVELHPSTTVLGALVVLRYRQAGYIETLIVFRDSLADEAAFRRLKVWLRWQAGVAQSIDDPV